MRKGRFTEEQVIAILREQGEPAGERLDDRRHVPLARALLSNAP